VTKQWMKKWPYVANVVFRIVRNLVKKVTLVGFKGGDRPLDPPLLLSVVPFSSVFSQSNFSGYGLILIDEIMSKVSF